MEEGLEVARRAGDRASSYVALYYLALVALSNGDHDRAATFFEEGATLSGQIRDRANVSYCLEGLAVVANARGARRSGVRASSVLPSAYTNQLGCPSTSITSPTARCTSAWWPPYVPGSARQPSRRHAPRDGR
jgi:hypothetical protein